MSVFFFSDAVQHSCYFFSESQRNISLLDCHTRTFVEETTPLPLPTPQTSLGWLDTCFLAYARTASSRPGLAKHMMRLLTPHSLPWLTSPPFASFREHGYQLGLKLGGFRFGLTPPSCLRPTHSSSVFRMVNIARFFLGRLRQSVTPSTCPKSFFILSSLVSRPTTF